MKKVFVSAFIAMAMFFANNAIAQVSHGGEPMFNSSKVKAGVPELNHPGIDNQRFLNEDLNAVKGAGPMRIGVMQDTRLDIVGESKTVKDAKGTHYLMAVESENATFMSLHFSQFELPEGATLFFYDQSGDFVLGSFNGSDVMDDGTFYTQAIPGSRVFVEYNVPAGQEPGSLVIDRICHGYKDIFVSIASNYEAIEESLKGAHGQAEGDCHINVVCDEGDDWRDQIRSVVAIEIVAGGYSYMCSGAVINNARQDKTPYVLSAFHCQDLEGTIQGFTSYFLYQTSSCNGTIGPGNKSVTGADIKAKYSYNGGSDFLLLKLRQAIPDTYKPFYAGWDKSNINPTAGACIHHPGGDYKKISIPKSVTKGTGSYSKFLITNWYTGTQNKGVTEQGSSGSPLFNADKRIIGQLYAGSSACDYMNGQDLYGRVYSSWNGQGTEATALKFWLDPDDTGINNLDGINYDYDPNVAIVTPEEAISNRNACNLQVYPNPSNGTVHFDVDALGSANYKLFDLSGRCVKEGSTVLTATSQAIDLGRQPQGSYVLQLHTSSRTFTGIVIIK